MADDIIPTWGYRKGEAQIFNLPKQGALRKGWADKPPRGEHPHEREARMLAGAGSREGDDR